VLQGLGFPADFYYQTVNLELNTEWTKTGDVFLPTTRELSSILDDAELKVLVVNGNDDYIVNTPGQKIAYDRLPWSGRSEFRNKPWARWSFLSEGLTEQSHQRKGGEVKEHGNLRFVTVDGAGHASPGDQPDAIWDIVNHWIEH